MESAPVLIDVRESDELEISRFPAYTHIPMSEITSRLAEIDPGSDLVIVCRTGNRSARVTAYLLQAGYPRVRNLAGGINEWVRLVDPSQPVY
jgi:adenylyltransferase/sulfurtransferase